MVDETPPNAENVSVPLQVTPAADVPEPVPASAVAVQASPPEPAALADEAEAEASDNGTSVEPPPREIEAEAPEEAAATEPEPAEAAPAAPAVEDKKHWYVVKVQSGREESIKEAIERRVKIEGLEEFFGEIIIPKEKETVMNRGRRVVREKKLYPGYLMANVEFNDRILYLFRETSGVGDFVGGSLNHPPQPMSAREVEKMKISQQPGVQPKEVVIRSKFVPGDRVKVKDGVFAGMEGEIKDLIEAKNLVRVELTVLGRPVPVELEYWQVETL